MRYLGIALAGTLLVGLGCADLPQARPPTSTTAPRGKARRAKGAGKAPVAHPDPQSAVPTTGDPNPLQGLTQTQICASDTLLLLQYPFDDLQRGTCSEVCCPLDPKHKCCALDWPFSDVPPCDEWAVLRNEIYARYGYPFQDERWKKQFSGASYYRRREDFDPSWLTDVGKANVQRLQELEQAGVSCTP